MLKNTIAALAAFGLIVSVPVMASQARATAQKAKDMTFEGKIESVDNTGHSFVVRNDGSGKVSEMRFHVGTESKVMIHGQRELLSQLEKGEHVTVTYEPGAQPQAKTVHRHKTSGSTR